LEFLLGEKQRAVNEVADRDRLRFELKRPREGQQRADDARQPIDLREDEGARALAFLISIRE
jgi:hypothetical protein